MLPLFSQTPSRMSINIDVQLHKKMFLKIAQISQENICVDVSLLTFVFLRILHDF